MASKFDYHIIHRGPSVWDLMLALFDPYPFGIDSESLAPRGMRKVTFFLDEDDENWIKVKVFSIRSFDAERFEFEGRTWKMGGELRNVKGWNVKGEYNARTRKGACEITLDWK